MLETTGITPVPGANFGQKPGTHHFRLVAYVFVVHGLHIQRIEFSLEKREK